MKAQLSIAKEHLFSQDNVLHAYSIFPREDARTPAH